MAPTNLSFEDPGGDTSFADAWQVRAHASASMVLGFRPTVTVGPIPDPDAFDAGTWNQVGLTVTPDAATDPNGGTDADLLTEDGAAGGHYVEVGMGWEEDRSYRIAAFLQPDTHIFGAVGVNFGGASQSYAIFDLAEGRVTSVVSTGNVGQVSARVTDIGGWFFCEFLFTVDADFTARAGFAIPLDGTTLNHLGNSVRSIFAWSAEVADLPLEGFEAFERGWVNDGYLFVLEVPDSAEPAVFQTSFVDPEGFESFESAWNNYPFFTTVAGAVAASFDQDGTPEAAEDFEELWGQDLSPPAFTTASFDEDGTPEDFEDFEDGWLTSPFVTTISGGVLAQWDGDLAEAAEDFEGQLGDLTYTVDAATDVFTSASHGLTVASPVFPRQPAGGNLPAPLNATIRVWPVTVTTNTFQLSLTSGGAAINLTDAGIGVQSLRGDPARFWIDPDGINRTLG